MTKNTLFVQFPFISSSYGRPYTREWVFPENMYHSWGITYITYCQNLLTLTAMIFFSQCVERLLWDLTHSESFYVKCRNLPVVSEIKGCSRFLVCCGHSCTLTTKYYFLYLVFFFRLRVECVIYMQNEIVE